MLSMKRLSLPSLSVLLLGACSLSAREPTDFEQYFLEVINRARADPLAEVERFESAVWGDKDSSAEPDLNEGLAPGTISPTPKPPLAFNPFLIDSASDYADFLLEEEKFDHEVNNSKPHERMQQAGYAFAPPASSGENIGITGHQAAVPLSTQLVDLHHEGYFVDANVSGRGHRIILLSSQFREVGIALRLDVDDESFFEPGLFDRVSVQNYASSAGRLFVTGVIYHDNNSNQFYDPGESAGSLPLEVRSSSGARIAEGTSFASGGYSINLAGVPAGSYFLVAIDEITELTERKAFWWDGTKNVKVDLVDPSFLSSPVIGTPYLPDLLIGPRFSALRGNNTYSLSVPQQVKQVARKKSAIAWVAALENDGYYDDIYRLSGSRGKRKFILRYLQAQGTGWVNRSAALIAGTPLALESGARTTFRITVKPRKSALGRRAGLNFQLQALSQNDASRGDRVRGTLVNRTKKPR